MELPLGFEETLGKKKIFKLRKSLYGLKQSPLAWFEKFTKSIHNKGCMQNQANHTMLYKHAERGKVTILIIYIDDTIVTDNDVAEMQSLKDFLAKEFEIKDLGSLRYFLAIEVAWSKRGIFWSQRKMCLELLKETGILKCEPGDTLIDVNHKIGVLTTKAAVDKERY